MAQFVRGFITSISAALMGLKKSTGKSLKSVERYLENASQRPHTQYGDLKKTLVLPELKIIYGRLSTGFDNPVDYLILGSLLRIQELIIESRIETDMTREIEKWHDKQPPPLPPIYTESGNSIFDEIRLTSPHYDHDSTDIRL